MLEMKAASAGQSEIQQNKTFKLSLQQHSDSMAKFYTLVSPIAASQPNPFKVEPKEKKKEEEIVQLKELLKFKSHPPKFLCLFYDYLKYKELSEENLEFWLALRNHNLLYKRYKRIKKETQTPLSAKEQVLIRPTPEQQTQKEGFIPFNTTKEKEGLMSMMGRIVNELSVDKKLLRHSAKTILELFLQTGAPKEVNLPNQMRQKIRDLIMQEKRYDPMIFNEAREAIFELMNKDSYPRFLKYQKPAAF